MYITINKNERSIYMIRDEITLDLLRTTSQCVISAKLGVTDREIAIKLREGAEPYFPDGVTAVLSATTPVGTTLYNDCRIENNTIYYSFTEATTGAVGAYDAEIILYRGEGVLASASFTIVVEKRASDPAIIVKSDEFTALDKMVTEGSKLYGDTKKIKEQTETLYKNTENLYVELTNKTNNWGIDNTFNPESEYAQSGKAISQYTNNTFANAITDNISGSGVSIRDISPVEHTLNVKVSSKNLIPYPFTNSTSTIKGVTFTDNGDGTITANGIPTENAIYYFINKSFVLPKGTYTLSGLPSGSAYETYYIGMAASVDGTNFEKGIYESGLTIEIDTVRAIYLVIKKGNAVNNLVFKPQLELGSTATPYAPYVADLSAVDLVAGGKNFAEINSIKTPTSEKPIIFSGKITGNFVLSCDVNCECTNMGATMFQVTSEDGIIEITPYGFLNNPNGYPLSGTITKIQFINYSACQDGSVDNIQLELGTSKTAFEPHTAPTTHPINADGTVDGVKSIYPTTTLIPTEGVVIDAEYIVDTKKYINKKIAEAAI
jgi:hypothetical protein